MAFSKPKRASGDVGSGRSIFLFASVFLMLGWLTSGEAIAQSAGDKLTSGPELVAGKEVTHWSGLPIWGEKEAREHGFELPLPLGVSGNFYTEKQGFEMPELKLGRQGGGLMDVGNLLHVTDIKTEQSVWNARLDAWLLPFLSVYAIAGYVDGQAKIQFQPAPPPFLPARGPKLHIDLKYEGPTVGLGTTVAAGFKPIKDRPTIVFGQADLIFTETLLDFEQVVSSLDPVAVGVFNMRLGVRDRIRQSASFGDTYLSLWGGAACQDVQEIMTGNLGILDLGFRGQVEAVNPWNTIVGGRVEIGKHFDVMVEVGLGERQSLMLAATFRF